MSKSRIIEDGVYYHLYNRGNHREVVFHEARDYERFLWRMRDAAAEYFVGIHAYCLMPNHFHALVMQQEGGSLHKMMQSFAISYAMYYNRVYGQVGQLFQGRYKVRRIMSDSDLLNVSRYIHRNPIDVGGIEGYEWSSFRAYTQDERGVYCNPEPVLEMYDQQYSGSYATFCKNVKRSDLLTSEVTVLQSSRN